MEAVTDIKQKKPKLILLNYETVKKFHHNKNNLVDNYIWKNYKLDKEIYGIQILKLKD
jgi:hypothetical protein